MGFLVLAMLAIAVVPLPESSAAQVAPPTEQQQAAQRLMDQLDNITGPVSMQDLTMDPALGPPPWLSFMPERDPSTIAAWVELAQRQGQPKAAPNAFDNARALDIGVVDIETAQEIGLNDTIATGQVVPGFNARTNPRANISGNLGALPPPPVCPSIEDDGSIPFANRVGLPPSAVARCQGTIGDGPFGETTGDIDFFEIGFIPEGDEILVDALPALPARFDTDIAIYSSAGDLIASLNDLGPEFLMVPAPSDEIYYAAVAGSAGLPANPFDSSSGPGATTDGDYVVFLGSLGPAAEPAPPQCASTEDDGSIELAVVTDVSLAAPSLCEGAIGDGPFGATSGDFDFYRVSTTEPNSVVFVDVADQPGAALTQLAVYDANGQLLGAAVATPGEFGIAVPVSAPGDYYAMISAPDQLPQNPFDSSSGNGATDSFVYLVAIGTYIELPPSPDGPTPSPTPTQVPAPPPELPTATPTATATPTQPVEPPPVEPPPVEPPPVEPPPVEPPPVEPPPGEPIPSPTATPAQPDLPTPTPVLPVDPPPPPVATCQSIENDDSFTDANSTELVDGRTACIGLIGDGDWASTTGDFDFFEIAAGNAEQMLDVALGGAPAGLAVSLYNSIGEVIVSDEPAALVGLTLNISVGPGTYYMMIGESGYLPDDPFSPGTGPAPNTLTNEYLAAISLRTLDVAQVEAAIPQVEAEALETREIRETREIVVQRPDAVQAQVASLTAAWDQQQAEYFANRDVEAERDALVKAIEPNMVIAACASTEDDGSIPTSNPTFSTVDIGAVCTGTIGDGPRPNNGDVDIFAIEANAGDTLIADIDAEVIDSELDSFVSIFDANGNIIAENDDNDGTDSLAFVRILNGGTYYVAVGAFGGQLPDPFDPSTGSPGDSTGDYRLTITQGAEIVDLTPDVDVYLVDLEPGDAIRAGFSVNDEASVAVSIVDPAGVLRQGSLQSASFLYPIESPLRHLGNIGADHVAAIGGQHAVIISGDVGPYTGELRVIRPGRAEAPGNDTQIIYLDFDGASVDPTIWDANRPSGEVTLSPLSSFLERWGLTAADEDPLIDAIIASFEENIDDDLRITGGNGDRDATGIPGQFDIEVRNSRDDADPWGQPNVSRIIVGGSIAEFGIPTIGIAQSIDPGNADPTETGVVLLDVLSEAPGVFDSSLNNFDVAARLTKVDLVGLGVGIIAAHEVGHFVGSWHIDGTNSVFGVMEPGGNLAGIVGLGPDLILGTADDQDVDFDEQEFSPIEGFVGLEDTATRTGFGFTTGQAPVINEPELAEPGVYYLQNVGTGRFLDADRGQNADTSSTPRDDDRWELSEAPGGWYLRNLTFDQWLDTDGSSGVDLSTSPSTDDVWFLEPLDNAAFLLTAVQRGANLTVTGTDVNRTSSTGPNAQWVFTPIGDQPPLVEPPVEPPPPFEPPPPVEPPIGPPPVEPPLGDFIGASIALSNSATERWLDGDPGNVDQSTSQQDDDVWQISDAGDGAVLLQNQVTGRYLDADGGGAGWNVDSSASPASDDRWEIVETPDGYAVRNVQYGRWLEAETSGSFNVVTGADLVESAVWNIVVIDPAALG